MTQPSHQSVEGITKQIEMMRAEGLNKEADAIERRLKLKLRETNLPHQVPSVEAEKILSKLITQDKAMLELKDVVRKLAVSEVQDSVLIIGETGTGKDIIAHALHGDRQGRFIPINCAGMPEYLIESELFGHERGAFSGADKEKKGLIEEANGGTLFLDEIGDMQYNLQAKLLRVIEEGAVRKVGGNLEKKVMVRYVAATHHDLEKQVELGLFRRDLYARLRTFPIITRPLRARRGDIKLIVDSLDPMGECYGAVKEMTKVEDGSCYWDNNEFKENVRDLKAKVRQYLVLGRIL